MSERPLAPLDDDERALKERLGFAAPPPPRRSDAAFARAVTSAVSERRARRPFGLLALAGASAAALVVAFALFGGRADAPRPASPDELLSASLEVVDAESEAVASLDDESLLALSAALDAKLAQN